MSEQFYCHTDADLQDTINRHRSELVAAGLAPERADDAVKVIRQFYQSAAVKASKMRWPKKQRINLTEEGEDKAC